jgi:hypothetical protein
MEKFSEMKSEQDVTIFPLTKTEFSQYKRFIYNLMSEFNKSNSVLLDTPDGGKLEVFKAYNYEKGQIPGREFSVLGKVNTNKKLITAIWQRFNITSFNHLKNFINKFKSDLFGETGKYFKSNSYFSVWDRIRATEMIGEANEDFVCNFIEKLWGPDSKPKREVTSSYKDMILGIDITFYIDGEEKTCQVKPLKFDSFKERGVVIIKTSGVVKEYKTDFIAFTDPQRSFREKVLIFKNEGGIFDSENETVTLPFRNLVNIKI